MGSGAVPEPGAPGPARSGLGVRAWIGRGSGVIAGFVLLDLLLPTLIFVTLTLRLHPSLAGQLDTRLGAPDLLTPSDSNGTIWFYWWFAQSFAEGKDLLYPDVVCAPAGQALGNNFPNRMDAWFALPFFQNYPFPRSFNLTLLAVPVAGALSGFWLFRSRGLGRLVALGAGACFGFDSFGGFELLNGRIASGLVLWYPLFLIPWLWALELPWRAAVGATVLAGLAGAAAVHAYVPAALGLLLVALASALRALFWPRPGVSRARPWAVGLGVVLVGALASAPYVHEVMVVRDAETVTTGQRRDTRAAWDPKLYEELRQWWRTPRGPSGGQGKRDPDALADAQPVSALWRRPPGDVGSRGYVAPILLIAGVAGAALAGRRGGWALLAMVGAWLLTLGPYAVVAQGPLELARVGGARVALPTAWILDLLPYASSFLRPYRYTPLLLLALGLGLGLGATRLGGLVGGVVSGWLRARSPVGPDGPPILLSAERVGGWVAAGVAGALSLGAAAATLDQVRRAGGFDLLEHPWDPPAGIRQIAADPEPGIVVELPVGIGHASALLQVVHQKDRSEGHHDLRAAIFSGGQTPPGCYELPFLEALWGLGRRDRHAAAEAAIDPAIDPAAIHGAYAAGVRYVVLYPELMRQLFPRDTPVDGRGVQAALTRTLGAPIQQDTETVVWRLPAP